MKQKYNWVAGNLCSNILLNRKVRKSSKSHIEYTKYLKKVYKSLENNKRALKA